MFESVDQNPPQSSLLTAVRLFYVVAILPLVGLGLQFVLDPHGLVIEWLVRLVFLLISGAFAIVVAQGLEKRKRWARTCAYAECALLLFGFPLGTILGVLLFLYVLKADRAGLFSPATNDDAA
jgi:hypothetical protein